MSLNILLAGAAPLRPRSAPIPMNEAARAAHAKYHTTVDGLNAQIRDLMAQVHQLRGQGHEAELADRAAIRAAHPEIGERDFVIDCAKDAIEIYLDAPEAEAPRGPRQPDWAKDMLAAFEREGGAGGAS